MCLHLIFLHMFLLWHFLSQSANKDCWNVYTYNHTYCNVAEYLLVKESLSKTIVESSITICIVHFWLDICDKFILLNMWERASDKERNPPMWDTTQWDLSYCSVTIVGHQVQVHFQRNKNFYFGQYRAILWVTTSLVTTIYVVPYLKVIWAWAAWLLNLCTERIFGVIYFNLPCKCHRWFEFLVLW